MAERLDYPSEQMDTFFAALENGGRIGVCPPCAKTHGLGDDDLVGNAEWMGGAAVMEETGQRRTMAF